MSILGSVFENTVVDRPSSPFNPKGFKVGLLPEFVQVLAIFTIQWIEPFYSNRIEL